MAVQAIRRAGKSSMFFEDAISTDRADPTLRVRPDLRICMIQACGTRTTTARRLWWPFPPASPWNPRMRRTLAFAAISLVFLASTAPAQDARPQRAPAVPLVTHTPYFSAWSMADRPTDDWSKHWTGTIQAMCGMVRIDGKPYRVLGPEPKAAEAMTMTNLEILPTRTIYTFASGRRRGEAHLRRAEVPERSRLADAAGDLRHLRRPRLGRTQARGRFLLRCDGRMGRQFARSTRQLESIASGETRRPELQQHRPEGPRPIGRRPTHRMGRISNRRAWVSSPNRRPRTATAAFGSSRASIRVSRSR